MKKQFNVCLVFKVQCVGNVVLACWKGFYDLDIREMLHHNWLDGIVELVSWEIERCSFTIGMLYFRQPELNGNEHNTLFMS